MNSEGTQPYIYMYPFSPKPSSHPGCHIILTKSFMCYTVGPCRLSILNIVVCTWPSQTPCLKGNSLINICHMTQSLRWNHIDTKRLVHKFHSSFACNSQQLETTQRCPPGGEKRYFLYSGVLLSNKNELTTDTPTTWMHLGNIMLRKRI